MFYLGTWKLGDLDLKDIQKILNYSINTGVTAFDTAMVYGNGDVESAIGNIGNENLRIVTKIPGMRKPELDDNIDIFDLYSFEYIDFQINESLKRMNKKKVHAILLHNWCYAWETKFLANTITVLEYIRNKNVTDLVGISLPNFYNGKLFTNTILFNNIDILECAYNKENEYITGYVDNLKVKTKEIILRSFLKGVDITDIDEILKKRVEFCLKRGLSFTIGSTKRKHILNNLKLISNLTK